MTNKAVSYAKRSANEDVVLNAGRVNDGIAKAGSVDVDKTLALLDEALDGRLFQEMSGGKSASKPEDEIIVVQEDTQDGIELASAIRAQKPKPAKLDSFISAPDVKDSSKQQNRNWFSRLTARITRRAS